MTQNQKIFVALQQGKTISPMTALREFNCMRLAARVYELRKEGHIIDSIQKSNGNATWVEYKMGEVSANTPPRQADWRSA